MIKEKLENELSIFLSLKNVVLFSSCRNALYTLLLSLNLKKSDEIIIQSFICDSLPQAIRKAGAKVVFAEVDENTLNLNLNEVSKKITKNTKAVVFVHTYGNPSGIKEVAEICKRNNLILIEDVAHALGAKYDGRLAGTFGDYVVYSFTKQMVNFGGGALLTNKEIDKIKQIKDSLHNKSSIFCYIKRLIASFYEARSLLLSKIIIDFIRKKPKLKLSNSLDNHFTCSKMEAFLALKQICFLDIKKFKKKKNYEYVNKYCTTQLIYPLSEPSYNYISFIFQSKEKRDKFLVNTILSLPPWSGSFLSDKIIFIPNSPLFNKRKLDLFIRNFKNLEQ